MATSENNAPYYYLVDRSDALSGEVSIPGDKSISQRAVLMGAIALGDTEIDGLLEAKDCYATIEALKAMGAEINHVDEGYWVIRGHGMNGLQAPDAPLNCHHSGTALRLLLGLLAGQDFDSELTGDKHLLDRSMQHVVEPLRELGADITTQEGGTGPFFIRGKQELTGKKINLPLGAHQAKSSLLLAGMYASGQTTIIEPFSTRNQTEKMLKMFGYDVQMLRPSITLSGGGQLTGTHINVPGDISIAAYFMIAASIVPGSDILIRKVGLNPTRSGVINILHIMGADISIDNEEIIHGEPVADIRVKYSPLQGVDIPSEQVPFAIDEFPVLFVAAACAKGVTILREAQELRLKESDRIHAMAKGLRLLGVELQTRKDGLVIEGGQPLMGGTVNSYGDPRVAMAFAVAGLVAKERVIIEECDDVYDTFPNIIELAAQVGITIETTS